MNMSPIELALTLISSMKVILIIPLAGIIIAIVKYRKNHKKMIKNIIYYILLTLLFIIMIFAICFITGDAFNNLIEIVKK